jgi:hypothetical protein
MALCSCGTDDQLNGVEECRAHPSSLTCELCHREEATHWTVEEDFNPFNGLKTYVATPVCDSCTPRVASGDRPDDIIAVPQIGLMAKAPWL